MDSIRQKRQRSRDHLDRRVDQWIETGRQFVDGVAGNRPGRRKNSRIDRSRSGSRFETIGRWVGDKVDWLLEEEDGWIEPWQSDSEQVTISSKKPLEAISRRVSQSPAKEDKAEKTFSQDDDWPDEDSFKINRWKRGRVQDLDQEIVPKRTKAVPSSQRVLPRSTRRRDNDAN